MNPTELLKTLEAEGVGVSLNLKVSADARPSDDTRALIRDNRDGLLEHLVRERVGTADASQSPGLTLYGDLLLNLMVWAHRYNELTVEHPGGVILNAKPEQVTQHLTHSAWAVLYDETKTILATAGNVPRHALAEKNELQPIATAQVPVTAEKVVN